MVFSRSSQVVLSPTRTYLVLLGLLDPILCHLVGPLILRCEVDEPKECENPLAARESRGYVAIKILSEQYANNLPRHDMKKKPWTKAVVGEYLLSATYSHLVIFRHS